MQCLTLARRIFTELGLKRVAISAREQSLWPIRRSQVSRCLAPAGPSGGDRAEVSCPATRISRAQLQIIRASRADAIVLWADETEAANILKQMRALGMKQRVFGSYRTLGTRAAGRGRPCGRRVRGGLSLRSHAQRSALARLQSALRSALPREAGAVCLAGL